MLNKEMRSEIKDELNGLPNQEFRPGAMVNSVGTKWVKWTDRSHSYQASIQDFHTALFDNNEDIYQIMDAKNDNLH